LGRTFWLLGIQPAQVRLIGVHIVQRERRLTDPVDAAHNLDEPPPGVEPLGILGDIRLATVQTE
jgi:hypothetical protein